MRPSKRRHKDLPTEGRCVESDIALFRSAVRGATPLQNEQRIPRPLKALCVPIKRLPFRNDLLVASTPDALGQSQIREWAEVSTTYLKDGQRPSTIRRLRRGFRRVQDSIDLHGLNPGQARHRLAEFLDSCRRREYRCVKIIHGKGLRSTNMEPVLRSLIRAWLATVEGALAFCEAPQNSGGSGATLALLTSSQPPPMERGNKS